MPSCSAKGCHNSSKKGVSMHRFPTDPERKSIWVKNTRMTNFVPKNFSVLCEYHFTAEMWEKPRVDGKKKLKHNAIPTIFGDLVFNVEKKINKENVRNLEPEQQIVAVQVDPLTKQVEVLSQSNQRKQKDHNLDVEAVDQQQNKKEDDIDSRVCDKNELSNAMGSISCNFIDDKILAEEDECLSSMQRDYDAIKGQTSGYIEKIKKLEKLYQKSENLRILMKKWYAQKERRYKATIQRLQKRVRHNISPENSLHPSEI